MTETLALDQFDTTSRAYQLMEHSLGTEGLALLDDQLQTWHELNGHQLESPLRDALKAGDTTLPAGTLLHGMGGVYGGFNEDAVASVSSLGIMSGDLVGIVEDAETHGCADFFKVRSDMTIDEYMKYTKERVQTDGMLSGRAERLLARGVTFIVDPDAEGMTHLMERDGYTDPEMGGFISPLSGRTENDTAAILGGVPRGAIAGILASPRLLETPEVLDKLKSYFPDTPVFDHEGTQH